VPTSAGVALFTGGTDNVFQTMYDTGNVVASITANGTTFSKSSAYNQTSSVSSIANDLYNQFIADANFNLVVRVSPPGAGATLQFTTVAGGAGTNYPITTTAATNSSNFAAGSTSFTITPPGNSSFVPGLNGILWDTGTVTATLTGFSTASVAAKQISYGQGSNAASVAGLLAAQMHNDPTFPVDAVVTPAGSATIVLTARDQGTDGNSYNIAIAGQTSQPASFTTPSFPAVSVTLANGANPVPSFTPGTVLTTTYTYNNNHMVVKQGQQTRTYVFDGLGRVISSTVPETGNLPMTATYTDFGAPATITDPRQLVTAFAYDPLNRVQSVTFSDGTPTLAYNYGVPGAASNTGGRLASVQQKLSNGTIVSSDGYQYDVMGRETQCSKTIAGNLFNIGYAYNADGSLQKITYPSGRTVNITEDDIGRLAQIASNGSTVLSAITYNVANEVLNATYGNSMVAQYTYNDRLQLSALTYGNAGNTAMNLAYNYGAGPNNGQILGITDNLTPSQSTSYSYDELGRLKTAQTNDLTSANTWKLKYGYDRYGNRLEQVPQAGTAAMPLSETPVDPTTNRVTTLQYDNAGNVVNDGLHSYAFNVLNQLSKVDGSATPFTYDAAGQRVIKNGTVYIYSGGQVIAEYNSAFATSPSVEYIYGAGGLLASVVPSGTMTYYYRDHLSNRSLASSTGATTGTLSTFPFGESRLQSGAATKWQFTSYERDSGPGETGLDYAMTRYFSPRLGRFMGADLLNGHLENPQSLNRFSYVLGDPVNLRDPFGMDNDCGGPCVDFSFGFGNCIVNVTYSKVGVDEPNDPNNPGAGTHKTFYDMPSFSGSCSGGGGSFGPPSGPEKHCLKRTPIQKIGIPLQANAAAFWNLTIGLGIGGSASAGNYVGVSYSYSNQLVVSPNGQAALVTTVTDPSFMPFNAAVTPGAGGYAGFQYSFSNAQMPDDIGGSFLNGGIGGGAGLGLGVDGGIGSGTQGQPVWQVTVTAGFGAGGKGSALTPTLSFVTPICSE
jgi:RHS repeat-associated protein